MSQTPEERRAYERAYRNRPENKKRKQEYDKKRWSNRTPEQIKANQERLEKYNGQAAVERVKKWRMDNPERTKELRIMGQARRRSRGEKDRFSVEEVENYYGTDCYICGEAIDMDAPRKVGVEGWRRSFWIDHVVALANGGGHTLDNVRPSHGECNLKKSSKQLDIEK